MNKPPLFTFFDSLAAMQFSANTPLLIFKLALLLILTIYCVFALVVIRQIGLMTNTIQTSLTGPLKFVGYLHMIIACVVWFFALVLL